MIDEADWSRLARYFAGECTPEETNATREWLNASDQRKSESERLRSLWEASGAPQFPVHTDSAWQRLAARMQVSEGPPAVALHRSSRASSRPRMGWRTPELRIRRIGLVAAPFLIAAGTLLTIERDDVAKLWRAQPRDVPTETLREFRTARGQRAVVVLTDGSRVELGTESLLRVRPFRDGARVVMLEGQAVFDVVHDSAHAFFVHAKNAVTEDLGTRFSIRGYPADNRVQVLVTSGKVALRAEGAPESSGTLLNPLDLGILDSAGQATVRNGVDTTSHLAWTRDWFVFDNAPLSEVLPEISRWFDVEIEVVNRAAYRRRVTVKMQATTLRTVMGQVTQPIELRYSIEGRKVVIR